MTDGTERRLAFLQRGWLVSYWVGAAGLGASLAGAFLRTSTADISAVRFATSTALIYGGVVVWVLGMLCMVLCLLFSHIEALMSLLEAAFGWLFGGRRKQNPRKKKKKAKRG